ncbi:MAG: alpha/beta fold hydrolase [Promethearchaeota archaeon]
MNTIVVGGNEIHFEIRNESNSEDTFVFIHGIGTSMEIWDAQVAYFSNKYKTVRFDWKGSGNSRLNEPEPDFSMPRLAKDLAGILENLNVHEPYLVAQDVGGLVVLKADIDDLVKSKGMVLVNCSDRNKGKLKYKSVAKWVQNKSPSLSMKESLSIREMFEKTKPEVINGWLKSAGDVDFTTDSPYISTPIDFIIGSGNSFVKAKEVEDAVNRIPKSRMTIMNKADFVMLEDKDGTNKEIEDFVDNYIKEMEDPLQ